MSAMHTHHHQENPYRNYDQDLVFYFILFIFISCIYPMIT